MAFKEGPGYKFTSASFLKGPPHGVLAKTGATKFLYLPFTGYKGQDSYAIKVCAIVQGRSGCSSLTYVVDGRYEPFDIIEGAQPPLRPLHLVVRETEFCGQRLAGDFSRRMRENGRNSVRRPRHASLTDRNCEGFCRPETASVCRYCMVGDAGIELMAIAAWHPFKTRRRVADAVRETICRSECQSRSRAN